jgi:uncharacterized phage infection (PIP) family protein YhgE
MATPTGIGAIEFADQTRQLEMLKEISDKAKSLQDVIKSLNDTESIGRFRASLTNYLSDITAAFKTNEEASKRYINELFNKLSEGQQKARGALSKISEDFNNF